MELLGLSLFRVEMLQQFLRQAANPVMRVLLSWERKDGGKESSIRMLSPIIF